MTAVAADPTPTIDISSTPQVPFGRLVSVELRKMWDTRAGFWLLGITGGLLVLALGIMLLVVALNDDVRPTATEFAQIMTIPVLAARARARHHQHHQRVEPAHRSGVLHPRAAPDARGVGQVRHRADPGDGHDRARDRRRRHRHAALAPRSPAAIPSGTSRPATFAWTIINQLAYFTMAFAFGLVFLSTPASIAIYYVVALLLPFMVYGTLYAIFDWAKDVIPWIDLGFAMGPYMGQGHGHRRDLLDHVDAGDRHRRGLGRAAVRPRPAPGDEGRAQVAPTVRPPRGGGGQP